MVAQFRIAGVNKVRQGVAIINLLIFVDEDDQIVNGKIQGKLITARKCSI